MARTIILAVFLIILATSIVYAAEQSIGISIEKKGSSWSFNPLTIAFVTSILSLLIMLVLSTEKYIIPKRPSIDPKTLSKIYTIADPLETFEPKETPSPEEPEKPSSHQIESFLKEDEQTIINILKLKEGSCTQGTLRVVTNFSKAKLSRILSELAERDIVHKESKGKKNVVSLKID